jgi:hypothetical protein
LIIFPEEASMLPAQHRADSTLGSWTTRPDVVDSHEPFEGYSDMRKTALLATALIAASSTSVADSTATANDEAGALIKQFATTLKGELTSAIKSGGPQNAVQVCKEKAPAIAANLSETSDWQIARTSLKTRNPNNAPDEWETVVLEQFESLKAEGKDVKTMTYAAVVDEDGTETYRFMKAIPTAAVCLTCHGKDIDPELAQVIDEAYPEDQARGYEEDDIRGAFTLSKPL